MPLTNAEWEEAETPDPRTPLDVVYQFLRDHPDTAYNMEEIADATGLYKGSSVEPFQAEAVKEEGPEGLIGTIYWMVLLSTLVEMRKVETRVREEPSKVKPGGRGVKYYWVKTDQS